MTVWLVLSAPIPTATFDFSYVLSSTGRYEDHDNTWLRWVDATGQLIPTGAKRAEHEHQRAERFAA